VLRSSLARAPPTPSGVSGKKLGSHKSGGPTPRQVAGDPQMGGAERANLNASSGADTANHPEAALLAKNRGALLRQALTRLSLEHREIIDLVYYHEQSIDECARILGIPVATVKTRMFCARKELADLIKDA
jgi:RNA polymerase sigma factor (sigma-70 family)